MTLSNPVGRTRSTFTGTINKVAPGKTPRIAIIGCGAITELFYLPAIAKHRSILERLVLVDNNQVRAEKLASTFGVSDYTSNYHEILNQVDGAIVAVPHHLHYRICMDFLRQGVNILCEKPLAETGVEVKEMIAQAEKTGVSISVNNTRRLFPSSQKVKDLISSGAIGDILSIKYFEGVEYNWPTASGFYFNSKTSPKGVLLDTGAHVLDLVCWWLGAKPKITSSENDSFGGCEAVSLIRFEHGNCSGAIKLSWLARIQNTFAINGELGAIEGVVGDWRKFSLVSKYGKREKINIKSKKESYTDFSTDLINGFLDVLHKGSKPLVSAHEVLPSIELLEEAYNMASRFNMPWCETTELSHVN